MPKELSLSEHKAGLRRRADGADLPTVGASHADIARLLAMSAVVTKKDGWMSALTGMGIPGKDKRITGKIEWQGLLFNEHRAEAIVGGSNLARRIVEHLPYEATRQGVKLEGFEDDEQPVQDALDELDVWANFFTGWSWARQFGGAGLLMVTDEEDEADLELPLWKVRRDGTKVLNPRVGKIKNLVPFNRWELTTWSSDIDTDLASPNFRKPKYYRLNAVSGGIRVPINVKIHYSRIIRFDGSTLGPLLFIRNNYWHDSIFSGLMTSFQDYDMSHEGVAQVLAEFRFIIHKMPNLAEMVADGKNVAIQKRLAASASLRNTTGVQVIDGEEEVTVESEAFSGVDAMLDRMANRFAAHTEYPKIVLFNESPEGSMGGNGSSEMDVWHSTVGARQRTYLGPRFDQLMEVLLASPEGPTGGQVPDDWTYSFPPLAQESAKEKAEREKAEAETDGLRMDQGVKDAVDIIQERFPALMEGKDPEELRLEIEAEKQKQMQEQMDLQKAAGDPGNPDKNAPPKKTPPEAP